MIALFTLLGVCTGGNMELEHVPLWTRRLPYVDSAWHARLHKPALCGYWNGVCTTTKQNFGEVEVDKFHYIFLADMLVSKEFHVSNATAKVNGYPTYSGLMKQQKQVEKQLKKEGYRFFESETTNADKYSTCGRIPECGIELQGVVLNQFSIKNWWKKDTMAVMLTLEGEQMVYEKLKCDIRYTDCWDKHMQDVHVMFSFTSINAMKLTATPGSEKLTFEEFQTKKSKILP